MTSGLRAAYLLIVARVVTTNANRRKVNPPFRFVAATGLNGGRWCAGTVILRCGEANNNGCVGMTFLKVADSSSQEC